MTLYVYVGSNVRINMMLVVEVVSVLVLGFGLWGSFYMRNCSFLVPLLSLMFANCSELSTYHLFVVCPTIQWNSSSIDDERIYNEIKVLFYYMLNFEE